MLCGAWLALLPMGAMAIGTVVGMVSRTPRLRRVTFFSAGVLVLYLAALAYGFLNVPYYCIIKASYTLGLVPCYAVLLTLGVSLCKTRWARAIAYGGLAACGAAAYCAYFVW
jgi:hypothetical protein